MYTYGETLKPRPFATSASRTASLSLSSPACANGLSSLVAAWAILRYGRKPPQPDAVRAITIARHRLAEASRGDIGSSLVDLSDRAQVVSDGIPEIAVVRWVGFNRDRRVQNL